MVVIRILVILMFALSGLTGSGADLSGAQNKTHQCDDFNCHEGYSRHVFCCETHAGESCSADDEECQCFCTAIPIRWPFPDVPLPRSDRSPLISLSFVPIGGFTGAEQETESVHESFQSFSVLAGFSNNEVQAFLSIWRT